MTTTPLDDDNYPNPLVSRPRSAAGLWRVGALAGFFILAAIGLSALGDRIPPDLVLICLGLLAVVGVFCLFAIAAGLFRFAASDETRTLSRAVVDSLPFGALVPVVHAARISDPDSATERGGGGLLGSLLLHETWGALLGIPLVHFVIVPRFGLSGAIAAGLAGG